MLRQRTFLKKTRRGKVIKVVREHYLRDDLNCGRRECRHCPYDQQENKLRLPQRPGKSHSNKHKNNHYLVLDTNVVLNQIDVLESEGLENVIVLSTVMQEVSHRSSPVLKRLKDLLSDPNRAFGVFVNEHHSECYVERKPGESANDRNDRAIRRAAKWYKEHLEG